MTVVEIVAVLTSVLLFQHGYSVSVVLCEREGLVVSAWAHALVGAAVVVPLWGSAWVLSLGINWVVGLFT
jgi:uncharacterized membrane protein